MIDQQSLDLGEPPRRPILRYHGGKWMIAKWIISHFPEHRIYVEPFGGAGSVLMKKPRSFAEVYNDLDDNVVNVFRILRDPDKAAQLSRLIDLTPWSRTEFFASYEETEDDLERARRTIVRTLMGFGTTGQMLNRTAVFAEKLSETTTPASLTFKIILLL